MELEHGVRDHGAALVREVFTLLVDAVELMVARVEFVFFSVEEIFETFFDATVVGSKIAATWYLFFELVLQPSVAVQKFFVGGVVSGDGLYRFDPVSELGVAGQG